MHTHQSADTHHSETPRYLCPWVLRSSNAVKGWKKLGCVNQPMWLKETLQWPVKIRVDVTQKRVGRGGRQERDSRHWDSPQTWFRPWQSDRTELKTAKMPPLSAQHSFVRERMPTNNENPFCYSALAIEIISSPVFAAGFKECRRTMN